MVLIGDFLDNVKDLINQYNYTKEETRQNFDNFIDNEVCYINGNFLVDEESPIAYTHILSTDGQYQSLNDILLDDLDEYVIYVESGTYTYTTTATFTVPVTIVGNPQDPPTINCTTGVVWCTLDYRNQTDIEASVSNIKWKGTQTVSQSGLYVYVGANKISVDNCTFEDIWATYNGRTLRFYNCIEGSDVTVTNCTFLNNKTTSYGHIFGSCIIGGDKISNLNVNHCTFNNLKPSTTNAKSGANGSAIIISNEDYSTTVPAIGNAVAYCNTYVNPSIDYNYRITESECSDGSTNSSNHSTLYKNIKTFIHQKFESKSEEDVDLPVQIEKSFYMINGVVYTYPLLISDFSSWTGTQPIYSDFTLPYNHEIIITFKGTPNIQLACSDSNNNWIYAQNIGFDNSHTFSYRNSSNGVNTKTPSFTVTSSSVCKITCYENIVKFYVDDVLIHSQETYDINSITRLIRIYNNANNVNSITVNNYKPYSTILTENDIIRSWNKYTDVTGRTIYKKPLSLNAYESIELEFKFKSVSFESSMSTVLGLDLYSTDNYTTRCAVIGENGNVKSYYSSSSSNRNQQGNSTTLDDSSIYKIKLNNGTAYWYKDDVLFASYSIERSSTTALRLDIFNNTDTHLDYLKITRGE